MGEAGVIAAVAAVALAGGWLGQRLRLPGGTVVGAFAAVAVLGLVAGWRAEPPEPLQLAAFVTVGWLLGESFDRDTGASLRRGALPIAVVVVGMAAVVGVLAWVLHVGFDLGVVTALLAATPGGLASLTAVALSLPGSEPLTVATIHLVRVLVVVTVVPLVLRSLPSRRREA